MRHYCTYYNSGFLIQGLALWRSLKKNDPTAILWVLALDEATANTLEPLKNEHLRVVNLTELEATDPGLAEAKTNRTLIEYYFTLSPCLPLWLLRTQKGISRITYLDADLLFFSPPAPIFEKMNQTGAAALITGHRFPGHCRTHYEKHGKFNVGIQCFDNSPRGIAILEDWRARCLEWCKDTVEGDRYADQKYLDSWPERFGSAVCILDHPGVNLAPWNWSTHQLSLGNDGNLLSDGAPVVVFHFARFRPIAGDWLWQSGQIDYGVMPHKIRNLLYGAYWNALNDSRESLRRTSPCIDFYRRPLRFGRRALRELALRLLFGSDWIRVGSKFFSLRFNLGRYSGRFLSFMRSRLRQ